MSQNHTTAAERKESGCEKPVEKFGAVFIEQTSAARRGDNYQSLEDHFLKLPPLAYYTLTYIFYSNFAVPFKLYLIKASHFCHLPQALLYNGRHGTSPLAAYTSILAKVPQTFINLICTALQITNIECLKIKSLKCAMTVNLPCFLNTGMPVLYVNN